MFGANLTIDLHKRSRISADDTDQRNSEFEIRLSAIDDPGDYRQEAARGSVFKGLSYTPAFSVTCIGNIFVRHAIFRHTI